MESQNTDICYSTAASHVLLYEERGVESNIVLSYTFLFAYTSLPRTWKSPSIELLECELGYGRLVKSLAMVEHSVCLRKYKRETSETKILPSDKMSRTKITLRLYILRHSTLDTSSSAISLLDR